MQIRAARLTSPIVQDAIQWMEDNQDKSVESLTQVSGAKTEGKLSTSDAPEDEEDVPASAASLRCADCGKLFRNAQQAEYHAIKT